MVALKTAESHDDLLPGELVLAIIDCLLQDADDDQERELVISTLKNASTVCRLWSAVMRPILFRLATVRARGLIDHLRLMSSTEIVVRNTTRLKIANLTKSRYGDVKSILEAAQKFDRLEKLVLTSFKECPSGHPCPIQSIDMPQLANLTALSIDAPPNVSLQICELRVALQACPNLEDLAVMMQACRRGSCKAAECYNCQKPKQFVKPAFPRLRRLLWHVYAPSGPSKGQHVNAHNLTWFFSDKTLSDLEEFSTNRLELFHYSKTRYGLGTGRDKHFVFRRSYEDYQAMMASDRADDEFAWGLEGFDWVPTATSLDLSGSMEEYGVKEITDNCPNHVRKLAILTNIKVLMDHRHEDAWPSADRLDWDAAQNLEQLDLYVRDVRLHPIRRRLPWQGMRVEDCEADMTSLALIAPLIRAGVRVSLIDGDLLSVNW